MNQSSPAPLMISLALSLLRIFSVHQRFPETSQIHRTCVFAAARLHLL